MAWSYFDTVPYLLQDYTLNKYFVKKFDEDTFLITTPHGAWLVLDSDEYRLLRSGDIRKNHVLFKALSDKGVIITEENAPRIIHNSRERCQQLFEGVSLHIVIITLRCNQKCVYCHAHANSPASKEYDMDEPTAKAAVDFMFQSPSKIIHIEFQGGECLLNFPIMKYIIEYSTKVAKKLKKQVGYSVVSNLTLMDEEKLNYLMNQRDLGIATSFDGPKHLHDKNRPYFDGRGSYDDVTRWIKKIKSDKKIAHRLNAMPTITKHSLPYASELVKEYVKYGFHKTWARYLSWHGRAASKWDEIGYTPDEFTDFWKEFLEHVLQLNKQGMFVEERYAGIYLKKMTSLKDPHYSELQAPCGAALGQMLYNYNGDIFPCDESKLYDLFKLGNVKKDSYIDIHKKPITSKIIRATTNTASLCDACVFSPYCGTCLVETYTLEGGLVSKLPLNRRCQINKKIFEHLFRKLIYNKEDREIMFSWLLKKK